MNVLVLGATGSVGRLVVEESLRRGHSVTALVRRPEKLGALASRVRAAQGDALDGGTVSRAIAGQDAVLYVLGAGNVPAGWADYFDTTKFPGKRGAWDYSEGGMFEFALMADGVAPKDLYPLDLARATVADGRRADG